jgi:simple sugar transport system ATP-binding protein
MRDVHKRFGSTEALRGASLELAAGEVHALLGENGSGKSTLVGVLFGLVRPERGELLLEGRRVAIEGPGHALRLGIALVSQHSLLVPALSVAENFLLGSAAARWLPPRALEASAREGLARHGIDLDPRQTAGELALGQMQRLEIARALERGARILILDEPTAALAPAEVEALLALLDRLRGEGRTVVFISHKLEEITQVCDRVTVLRGGQTVGTRAVAGITATELSRWMVGEDLAPRASRRVSTPGQVALALRGVRAEGLRGIDLEVRRGEIAALAGIDGNGQGPLEALFCGVLAPDEGVLEVRAPPLAVLSGDRHRTGLVLDLSLEENLVLRNAAHGGSAPVFAGGFVRRAELRREAARAIERFAIRGTPRATARSLSGGNQQKLLVARALRADPGVLVAVNPTRGLDVASTRFVHQELRARATSGAAVLLISTDLDEVIELADRIRVLFRGELLDPGPGEASRGRIGELMLGGAAA